MLLGGNLVYWPYMISKHETHFEGLMQVPLTTEERKQVVDYDDTYTDLS